MALHTLIYLGNLDRNFAPIGGWPATYETAEGAREPVGAPSSKARGVKFGYMEKAPKAFFLVNVEELRLRAPVLLIPERHSDGKGFGPRAALFGDDAAMALLVDAIVSNPEYRDHLAELIRSRIA